MKSVPTVIGICGVVSIVSSTTLVPSTSAENRKVRKCGSVIRVIFVSFLFVMILKQVLSVKMGCKRRGMSGISCSKKTRAKM